MSAPPTARIHEAQSRRLESVVRREAAALLAYFERRVPYSDAPDLLGDTLLVAWRRVDALPTDDQEARMWLFGVARRVLGTSRRGFRRRQALFDRLREEAALSPEVSAPIDCELHEALAALDPVDSEIIRLVHWDGFSLAEVERHLERPAGTVRSRYSRARSALKGSLQQNEE